METIGAHRAIQRVKILHHKTPVSVQALKIKWVKNTKNRSQIEIREQNISFLKKSKTYSYIISLL